MTPLEWLNEKREYCSHGIKFYQDKIKALEKDLGEIERIIDLMEGQPAIAETAQRRFTDAGKDRPVSQI